MKYTVKQEPDIRAIAIDATGLINSKVAEKMVLDAGVELKKHGFKKCFFDLKKTVVDPNQTITDMFMFADVFKKAGINKSVRMAALYISGGERRLVLEKAAKDEGFNLKHFTDKDEAINWLCR